MWIANENQLWSRKILSIYLCLLLATPFGLTDVYNIEEMCEQLDMTNLEPKQDLIFVLLCHLCFFGSLFVRGTVRREVWATRWQVWSQNKILICSPLPFWVVGQPVWIDGRVQYTRNLWATRHDKSGDQNKILYLFTFAFFASLAACLWGAQ